MRNHIGHVPTATRPPIPKATRDEVISRASGLCEQCQKRLPLELHHLTYDSIGFETAGDLLALCRDCHRRRHVDASGEWWNDPEEMSTYWAGWF